MDKFSVRQLNSIVESYSKNADFQRDREMTLIVARRQPALLSFADKKFLSDEEIALEAVKTDGQALRFFSEKIRSNERIVLVAVENFCKSFAFAEGNARKNLEIAQAVAKRGGETIALLEDKFLNDLSVATLAVERNPRALGFFSEKIRSNENLALYAITKDRTAVEFVADRAFKNKKIFEKAVLDYSGNIKVGALNNLTPQGVFDEIERRNLKFNLASQNIDLMTVDRDKLTVCLKLGEGSIGKKSDLLRKYILAEDKDIIALIIERGGISQKTLAEEVKFASKNKKIRVLPLLLKYTGGASAQASKIKDERMYEMRSLRRKSPVAVARFKENYEKYLGDVEMVMLAAYADGNILKTLAHTDYIKDEKFVTECLKSYVVKNSDGAILDGIDVELTYEQAELACIRDGRNFFHLKEDYKKDPKLAVLAVRSCEDVYNLLPEEFQNLPEVIKEKRLWIK